MYNSTMYIAADQTFVKNMRCSFERDEIGRDFKTQTWLIDLNLTA